MALPADSIARLPGRSVPGHPEVVVAVIDTGILQGHPDLAGQLVNGYDFVRNVESAMDGDGIDSNPQDPGSSLQAVKLRRASMARMSAEPWPRGVIIG